MKITPLFRRLQPNAQKRYKDDLKVKKDVLLQLTPAAVRHKTLSNFCQTNDYVNYLNYEKYYDIAANPHWFLLTTGNYSGFRNREI